MSRYTDWEMAMRPILANIPVRSYPAVGRLFGVSGPTVRRWATEGGFVPFPSERAGNDRAYTMRLAIAKLVAEGIERPPKSAGKEGEYVEYYPNGAELLSSLAAHISSGLDPFLAYHNYRLSVRGGKGRWELVARYRR